MKGKTTNYNNNHSLTVQILYKDEYIVVINKPSGLLSVPYPGSSKKTAINIVENILRSKGQANKKHKPYAVHRLDKDTSGVMMFALNPLCQKLIMNTWHKMVKERLYMALAQNPNQHFIKNNQTLKESGTIDDNIAKNAYNVGFVPKNNQTTKKGKQIKTEVARTHYKKIYSGKSHTLFCLSLDTGKKNQIRAHLAHYGYVLCGDVQHYSKSNPFNRLTLHAKTLEFIHPYTKELLSFKVDEPVEWLEFAKNG